MSVKIDGDIGVIPIGNASDVAFTPAGTIAANNVQAALQELDTEKLALSGGTMTGHLNGITPTAAANLTRKDYVDTKLSLNGGTLTGDLALNSSSGDRTLVINASARPFIRLGNKMWMWWDTSGLSYFGTDVGAADWYLTRGGANVATVSAAGVTNISDRRLKSDIQPAACGLTEAAAIKPHTFVMNGVEQLGLIAQDVEAAGVTLAVAEVHYDEEFGDIKTLNPMALIAHLYGCVNELSTKLDTALARIAELEVK